MQPDTLFVEFNQTPSAERAMADAPPPPLVPPPPKPLVVRSGAPAASGPAALPLAEAAPDLEEAKEDAEPPRIQRREAGRATRAAGPPLLVPGAPPQAAAAARAVREEDGLELLPDLHGDVPSAAAPRSVEMVGGGRGAAAAAQTR